MADYKNKDIFGIIFFALSIVVLAYMFITPLSQLITHIDEYFTISVVQLPIREIITVNTWDVHPPLHYFLGKAVAKICEMFGVELIYGLKVLSIIPYILILIVSATKIRKEYGLFAAGLFAFSLAVMSEFFRYYLTARMYSWAILFVLLAFLSFKEIIADDSSKKSWIMLTIFSVLCAYTHNFAAITAGSIYLVLLGYILLYKKEDLKNWGLSVVGAVVLYVPWIFALINQLSLVHESYWIPEVNLEKIIQFFGYYAYTSDTIFAVIAIVVLAVVIFAYVREAKDIDKKDQFLVLSGIGVYAGTIILGILISVLFKPIIVTRYLMPATGVLWLTISIILSKIENKKLFLISFSMICLLLISGIATTISTNDNLYKSGMAQKEVLDNITQDNNSMTIVNRQHLIMYFLSYTNQTDMHYLNVGHVFGVNMNTLHKLYDFETVNGSDIDALIANNTDKNIYLISWNAPQIKTPTKLLYEETSIWFSKVNTTGIASNNTSLTY